RPGRGADRRVRLPRPGRARPRAAAVFGCDPRALGLPHAGGQPARPERPAGRVLPAGEGRADCRGDRFLAGLAVPGLGVRRARPARQGKAVELHLPRRGQPPVPDRHHAVLPVGGPVHALLLGLTPGGVQNLIQVDQYLSFVMAMMLAFGLAFEVPVLIIMLNLAGILTHERFARWRRVLIFGVFLIAGAANPSPDPVTLLILGGTCAGLVGAAELIGWAHDRRRARPAPGPAGG